MIELIEKKIKEKYGTKEAFCEAMGYNPKDFSKKLNTVSSKKKWLQEFLDPLDLDVQINEKSDLSAPE